jgi:hypothetical protein
MTMGSIATGNIAEMILLQIGVECLLHGWCTLAQMTWDRQVLLEDIGRDSRRSSSVHYISSMMEWRAQIPFAAYV